MKSLIVERDVDIRMRDGVVTSADVYKPQGDGPFPVLLQRTPYGKEMSSLDLALMAAERGYAVVIQDTRGRWSSQGEHYPFRDEFLDGYDSVEWAGAQPWSNGKVGMFGGSYVSFTQWSAAVMRPPSLKALFPTVSFGDCYEDWLYPGGVFALGVAMSWGLSSGVSMAIMRREISPSEKAACVEQLVDALDGLGTGATFRHLPLDQHPLVGCDGYVEFLVDWLNHPENDSYWQALCIARRYSDVQVPVYHLGGWYDIFCSGTLRNFTGMQRDAGTEVARRGQKLIMGPWLHGPLSGVVGEVDFGYRATGVMVDVIGLQLRWFDHWLKGEENGIMEEAPVRLFVMGVNRWRNEDAWPLARAVTHDYYLHSGGAANSGSGDGTLNHEKPGLEPVDSYVYDPHHPVPTRGGGLCCYAAALPAGAFDQREVEARPDVLVYTSAPLPANLEVTGPVEVNLWAETTAEDTCFTAKLVDVSPDGYARNVTDGILRTGAAPGGTPTPGQAREYAIHLSPTCNVFLAGHRIRVEISSSNFPRFDRHPNALGRAGSEGELRTALQTVLHDEKHPSRISLPVVSAG